MCSRFDSINDKIIFKIHKNSWIFTLCMFGKKNSSMSRESFFCLLKYRIKEIYDSYSGDTILNILQILLFISF